MSEVTQKIRRILIGEKKQPTYEKGVYTCPVCGTNEVPMIPLYIAHRNQIGEFFKAYQKHQFVHSIFLYETFNIEDFVCAHCGANDKDRLYTIYIKQLLKEHPSHNINLLDIAPSPTLAVYLKSQPQIRYRSMDLYMDGVDDKADITNMHIYKDGQFDFFICSHVLEHVPDDIKAMKELYRVLAGNGKGIVMVPINLGVESTIEDPYGTDVAKRWKYFGQDDHVRMYAKQDFIQRLLSVGFKVNQLGSDHFTREVFEKAAVYPTSVLYIVSK